MLRDVLRAGRPGLPESAQYCPPAPQQKVRVSCINASHHTRYTFNILFTVINFPINFVTSINDMVRILSHRFFPQANYKSNNHCHSLTKTGKTVITMKSFGWTDWRKYNLTIWPEHKCKAATLFIIYYHRRK